MLPIGTKLATFERSEKAEDAEQTRTFLESLIWWTVSTHFRNISIFGKSLLESGWLKALEIVLWSFA